MFTKSNKKKINNLKKKYFEGGYEIRSNKELATLFNDPNIVAILKSQKMRWAHMASRGPTYTDCNGGEDLDNDEKT